LIHTFPLDFKDKNGTPFWSGAKRPPTPINFDVNDPIHLDFIVAASMMRAYNFGIIKSEFKPQEMEDIRNTIKEYVKKVHPPKFVPKDNIKIETDEKATKKEDDSQYTDEDDKVANEILEKLPPPSKAKAMNVIEFEKDDDRNFHIDFITAASNLRAIAYRIPTADRLESKLIAGKIIPAIVTTTALVTGLVGLEIYKVVQGNKKITEYRNSFVNLAIPVFQLAEPIAAPKLKFRGKEFDLWSKLEIRKGDLILSDLLEYFKKEFQMEVDVLSINAMMVYTSWMQKEKLKERMAQKVTDIVQIMQKKPLDQQYFQLSVTGSDAEGNEIEDMPDVFYYWK